MIISVSGVRSDAGTVKIFLFSTPADFPTKRENAVRTANPPAVSPTVTVRLDNVPPGTYALAAYHDENGNGTMDRWWYGPPKEGSGASNNAKGTFGPPSFDDARFFFRNSADTIKIFITY